MQQHLGLPFHEWNYAHNLNYLSYFREQLGMAQAAPRGARELLAAPLDSKFNNPNNLVDSTFREGLAALVRALVKFERWEEILDPGTIPWPGTLEDRIWKSYCEALALHGLERYDEAADRLAELKSLQAEAGKREKEPGERHDEFQILEIEGLLALARGDGHDAVQHLTRAAERELDIRKKFNDPPYHPRILYNVLGESYLRLKAAALAVASFERALDAVPNDGIALAGLIQAHAALGETQKAQELYGRLLHVWSGADSRIRWLAAARALGLAAQPKDHSPAPQRDYLSVKLDDLGPPAWEPFDAPTLDALDSARKTVTLEEYRGRNVVLIFYLGEQCVHCVEQLVAIKDRINDFSLNRTEVLAISSATPEKNAGSQRLGDLGIRLLSDLDHANARRFKSFDDFEDLELHSTILIDGRGRLHWARFGGEPFMDLDFLVAEIRRVNDREGFASAAPAGRE
jgi:peroxiredoxin